MGSKTAGGYQFIDPLLMAARALGIIFLGGQHQALKFTLAVTAFVLIEGHRDSFGATRFLAKIAVPLVFPALGRIAVSVPTAAFEFETAGRYDFFGLATTIRAFDGAGAHFDEPLGDGALGALEFVNRHVFSFQNLNDMKSK